MLNCEETSKLVSEGLDRKLPWRKRLAVKFHLFMCSACSAYKRQLIGLEKLIRQACGKPAKQDAPGDDTLHLSEDARRRIVERMRTGQ